MRHSDGEAMIREIAELGFDRIELGHNTKIFLVEGIVRAVDKGLVQVSSVHNFCPVPVEVMRASPDCYKFSAPEERERERALRHTFATIDFAQRLNARFVVLHLGRTSLDDYTDRLIRMAEVGMINSREFVRMKIECIRKRESIGPRYLDRAKECLRKVADYAADKGVQLGVESRHSYEEIPNEREMLEVLDQFNEPGIGYWHDFGHVQVKHNLGYLDHFEWMEEVAPRLLGCHLHDTQWPGRDHMAPFQGDVQYDRLVPLLPKDTLFVFEMSPRRTVDEISTARTKWIEKFGP